MKKTIAHIIGYLCIAIACFKLGAHFTPNETIHPKSSESIQVKPKQLSAKEKSDKTLNQESIAEPEAATLDVLSVFEIENEHERNFRFQKYLEGMTAENALEYYEKISALPPSSQTSAFLRNFYLKWGEIDGPAAFAFAQDFNGRDRLRYISLSAKGWAKTDPTAAWESIMVASNNGSMWALNSRGAMRSIAQNDIQLATQLLSDVKGHQQKQFMIRGIIEEATRTGDFGTLLEASMAQNDPQTRKSLISEIFKTWGGYETDAPLEALSKIADEETSTSAMKGFMEGWAAVDGSGAFAYALMNQDPPGMAGALESVSKAWARNVTSDEMENVMAQVSSIDDSDKLVRSVIYSVAQANPELALSWAEKTEDATIRSDTTGRALAMWAFSDIDAAENYYHSIDDEKAQANATWSIANSLMNQGDKGERIIALLNNYEDPAQLANALGSVTYAVANNENRANAPELQSTLIEMIHSNTELEDDRKQTLLSQLK
ncbi:hypothetical protein MLD52_11275 [Puniceicoccaceae bacterium K14]|nr:hypothetical protein [Puniceicoccaceae bacterium K14]